LTASCRRRPCRGPYSAVEIPIPHDLQKVGEDCVMKKTLKTVFLLESYPEGRSWPHGALRLFCSLYSLQQLFIAKAPVLLPKGESEGS
jgi:hypothetical protein